MIVWIFKNFVEILLYFNSDLGSKASSLRPLSSHYGKHN